MTKPANDDIEEKIKEILKIGCIGKKCPACVVMRGEIKSLITSREKRVAESIRNKCVETLERLRNEILNYSDSPTALKIELNSGLLRCIYELKNGVE